MRPIQSPITGTEPGADLTKPEQALSQFYRAFNHRDLSLMSQNWLQSEEAAMDNPLGGIKRGWLRIERVYSSIFEGVAAVTVEFFDYTLHLAGEDFFYAVGRQGGLLVTGDGPRLPLL